MRRANRVDVLPLGETIGPLAWSILPGAAVLTSAAVVQSGFGALILAPLIAFWCLMTAAAFVFPLLAVWPSTRRPSYPLAAIWGIVAAWIAVGAIVLGQSTSFVPTGVVVQGPSPFLQLREMTRVEVLVGCGVAGAASGLLYAHAARRRMTG